MTYPRLLASLFLWVSIPGLCRSQQAFAGPFKVIVNRMDHCDDSGTRQIYISSTKISKVSRNKYVYSTNVTSEVTINDDVTGEFDLAIFGNGGWRPHYIQAELPEICAFMKRDMSTYYYAIREIIHSECPLPPGIYEIKEILMEVTPRVDKFLPHLPYGKYRTDFSLLTNGTLIGCVRIYSNVIPAKRRRQQKTPKT